MSPLPTARIAWFNGKYLPENEVFPGAGWKNGDGAIDMPRTFNGRAFRMKEHVEGVYREVVMLRAHLLAPEPGNTRYSTLGLAEVLLGLGDRAGAERELRREEGQFCL